MNSICKLPFFLYIIVAVLTATWAGTPVRAQVTPATPADTLQQAAQDTIPANEADTLLNRPYEPSSQPVFQPKDRFGDPFSFSEETSPSPLLLDDPSKLEMDVEIDTALNYTIYEKIGDLNYRPTTTMSFDEFSQLQQDEMIKSYWQEQSAALDGESAVSGRGLIPPIYTSPLFDRLFGGSYVDIRPNGFVTLDFGVRAQRIDNPQIPIRQQRTVNFEFDQQISLNVTGKVGEKLAITANFDNNNSFDFQNDVKVEYTGFEEEIIKKIELGTVSLPVRNSLMSGSQSLFGLKTELQFGKLFVTGVATIQRGQTDAVEIEGGTQSREFTIRGSDYDENRHFFLAHYFRDNYEEWIQSPQVFSRLNVTRVEVYVLNRNNDTETQRNFVSFMDLGEGRRIYQNDNPKVAPGQGGPPRNNANSLFIELQNTQGTRDVNQVSSILENDFSFENSTDYVKITSARKLDEREFAFNSELGYISLFRKLQNDEVLAVAFEYTYEGQSYKVGELTEDYQNRPDNEVIFLKMLRPNKINTTVPTWDLMMKNIYSLNASQVNQQGFEFRVVYRDDETGVDNPSLHEGNADVKDVPLISLLGLDQLNPNNDPQPDGNFDFVEGLTINPDLGNVIFPVLEPFGQALDTLFTDGEQNLVNKYVYDELYETTKAEAELETTKNKFFLVGRYTAGSSNEIMLPGINIAEGSVIVYAGNTPLTEGTHFTVDYNLGKVNLIDEGIVSSGKKIRITYEKADLFNFQTRTFLGTRLEYRFNDDINLGATVLHVNERPIVTRVGIGSEPTKNTQYGLDLNFRKDSRFLTKMVDFLPLIQTKETSTITLNAEYAQLVPGTSNVVDGEGASYIDDFENTMTPFNLGGWQNWQLASTPETDDGRYDLRAQAGNDLGLGYKRAKLAWYVVDNGAFYTSSFSGIRPDNIPQPVENHYERSVPPQEIFTNQDPQVVNTALPVFDIAYFPEERGSYNYNPDLAPDGRLENPETNWGGITRAITSDVDFDKTNVEYLEFWLLDPFIEGQNGIVQDGENNTNNTTGGELVFNLGSVSEDLIVDDQHGFENGLPADGSEDKVRVTDWGRVTQRQFLTNAFDNTSDARENQDIGQDGLKNEDEADFHQDYINNLTATGEARQRIIDDPSADNFEYYLGDDLDARDAQIVERYKNFNNQEGNSPINAGSNLRYTPSGSQNPDNEDLNRDNTLSDLEEYYEYRIPLRKEGLRVGQNHIVDVVEPEQGAPKWYLFRIPIREPDRVQGNIQGFKSIRFARMYLTKWQQPVVLRMVKFQLVGSQWRKFEGDLFNKGLFEMPEPYNAGFNISVVNIEENAQSVDGGSPYVLPPGIKRDRDNTSAIDRRQNEQSIQLCVDDLRDKDARAVYKNMTLDMINYGRVKMFLHAESQTAQDSSVTAFLRFGTDFNENYYEVEVPLVMSPPGVATPEVVWPEENEIDVELNDLYSVKSARNISNVPINLPYTEQRGKHRITVVGRPELSTVQTVMIGIRNPDSPDGAPQSVCIWANELRVTDFDRTKGWAANARVNAKLADFGNVTASARRLTFGFGGVQSRIAERSREDITEYDVSGNFELGKLTPDKWGLQVPMYASYERGESVPQFDPRDPDIPLEATLDAIVDPQERNNYLDIVTDQITRRSLNFTNVRKIKTNETAPMFYDISNFSFSYAYSDVEQSNFNTAQYLQRTIRGGIAYNYTFPSINIAPFSGIQSPWLGLISGINFSPLPTSFSASADLNRTFFKTLYRDANLNPLAEANYQKSFTFNRQYDLRWNLTSNLALDYTARANAIVDEPEGDLDTEDKRETVWDNLKKLGRMKNFDQQITATYTIPFDRLPVTDWIKADVRYLAGYSWRAGAFSLDPDVPSQAETLGNVIENTRDRSLNGQLDFVTLYNKVRLLKEINSPPPRRRGARNSDQEGEEEAEEAPKENRFIKGVLRLLMSVRTVSATYSINEGTRLPGYMRRAYLFGMDSNFVAPGVAFLLGSQDPGIRKTAASEGWLSTSSDLTTPFSQISTTNFNIKANVEPARDLRIQLDVKKSKTGMYQELFQVDSITNEYSALNPSRNGSYSISYYTLPTAFDKLDANNITEAFANFEAYRNPIRDRLAAGNPNESGEYDINSQDVLIPAFIAAYTGQTPGDVKLNPFPKIPLPNWRVDYTGLPRLFPGLSDVFQSVSITHGYTSTYDVSNYSNALAYNNADQLLLNNNIENYDPTRVDQVNDTEESNLWVPTYIVQQVAITERFNPLIGLNLRTKSRFTARAEYRIERSLALQLSNTQITELRSDDFNFEIGFTKSDFKLPFRFKGRSIVLENDLTFRMNIAVKDTETIQRKIDDESTITNGNLNFQLRPTISYVLNEQLQLQFYFTRNVNDPKISNSFKRTTTESGIQIRFNLAQ